MTSSPSAEADSPRKNAPWKRVVIVSVSASAGFALMLALIVGGVLWYNSHPRPPKPWNTSAIKATYDTLTAEGDDGHLVFYYVLENTTDSDYRLEESSAATIMGRLKEENSLSAPAVKELQMNYPRFHSSQATRAVQYFSSILQVSRRKAERRRKQRRASLLR